MARSRLFTCNRRQDEALTAPFVARRPWWRLALVAAAVTIALHGALNSRAAVPTGWVPVTRNDDWTPRVETFDGVEMVLVPAGCFMMGSNDGDEDEKPVHEQCFDAPFWIDRYEVTNAQFAAFGGVAGRESIWTEDNRPRESITWFEANDFCALRGTRLPAEAEWEYAARGPDGISYTWGDTWNENLVVSNRGFSQGTAEVGSIPAGASWVGALDMSGNVWEWVSSLYVPYDSQEDREAYTGNWTDVRRVLRGGSWYYTTDTLRAANRGWDNPDGWFDDFGFRCARPS
ncbi:MAG: formylglycine-generating enzyme family protein [Chloroflexi bacterium]|nr:formylglycine-generating enzyme family protein [Chloroflexota bacterium]